MNIAWLSHISGGRIQSIIDHIARISLSINGEGRSAAGYSKVEDHIFNYVRAYILELNQSFSYLNRNLDIYDDAAGNMYVTMDSDKEEIVSCGSHVDSVEHGGNYDGVMGIAAGLEIFRVLFEDNIQARRAFRLIVFRAEEGSAVGHSALGSAIATGQLTREDLQKLPYGNESFKQFMINKGYDWDSIGFLTETPIIDPEKYRCYLEFHIEQGRVLEQAKINLGVVNGGIGGASRWRLTHSSGRQKSDPKIGFKMFTFRVFGRADHTGGSPMNGLRGQIYREDALLKSCILATLIVNTIGGKICDWRSLSFSFSTICSEVLLEAFLPVDWEKRITADFLDEVEITDFAETEKKVFWSADAVMAVVKFIQETEKQAANLARATDGLIAATVGGLRENAGEIAMLLDIRILEEGAGRSLVTELTGMAKKLGFEKQIVSEERPALFEPKIIDALKLLHKELFKKEAFLLPSMPGHDARNMAKKGIPTGMIFAPCREGISHSPREYVKPVDMEAGAKLLAAALVYFANR